jgi:ABC-2 type transport system ATP-binding protein
MEEAERVARNIAIIDHGTIIASGTAASLRKATKAETLEDAFLTLTGRAIREEEASASENMRMRRQMFRGRR